MQWRQDPCPPAPLVPAGVPRHKVEEQGLLDSQPMPQPLWACPGLALPTRLLHCLSLRLGPQHTVLGRQAMSSPVVSPRRACFCLASFWKTLLSTRLRWLRRMKGGAREGRSWYSTMRW